MTNERIAKIRDQAENAPGDKVSWIMREYLLETLEALKTERARADRLERQIPIFENLPYHHPICKSSAMEILRGIEQRLLYNKGYGQGVADEHARHAAEIVKAKRYGYEDAAEIVYTNNYDGIIEGTITKIVDDIMAAAEAECGPPDPKEETPPPTAAQLSKAYDEIRKELP